MARASLALGVTQFTPPRSKPLLVLGPSLGTSARTLWGRAAQNLVNEFDVIAWDLPGHGNSRPAAGPFSIEDLAAAVLTIADSADQGSGSGQFIYAGDSIGGAVGLQLLLDSPGRVDAATLLCTGAQIGARNFWLERAEQVRFNGGISVIAQGAPTRWFGPGFADREKDFTAEFLADLQDTDEESYAWACEALSVFDVRHRLREISTPLLAVAGGADQPTPVASLREIAVNVIAGRLVVLGGVGHLAPAESPDAVARLIADHTSRVTVEQRC